MDGSWLLLVPLKIYPSSSVQGYREELWTIQYLCIGICILILYFTDMFWVCDNSFYIRGKRLHEIRVLLILRTYFYCMYTLYKYVIISQILLENEDGGEAVIWSDTVIINESH